MLPLLVNTWDTGAGLPVILAMADTVIETTEITETLIAIVRRVVGMRGIVIGSEGTVETGETAGARRQPAEVVEDIRLNIGAEGVTQGVHRGEEALAATGTRTVRVVLASPRQAVQIHAGEVDAIMRDENRHWFDILKVSPFAQCPSKCMPNRKTDNSTAMSSLPRLL